MTLFRLPCSMPVCAFCRILPGGLEEQAGPVLLLFAAHPPYLIYSPSSVVERGCRGPAATFHVRSLLPGHFRISRYVQVPIIIGFGVSMGQGPNTCSTPSRSRGIWVLETACVAASQLPGCNWTLFRKWTKGRVRISAMNARSRTG